MPKTDFAATRRLFSLPEDMIYLDGNSLGPLPIAVRERVSCVIDDEWSKLLIKGWNEAGWYTLPNRVADKLAPIIGAVSGSVAICDSTSVNLFKTLSAALEMRPGRSVILSDTGNFPTDLYVAQGLIRSLGRQHSLETVAPEEVVAAINSDVAVVMLTQVDYRTGRLHDMVEITRLAHEAGALVLWDLAHSAGALPVDLMGADADFAIGCGYKYLNGGPGAPAFLFVHPRHHDTLQPALSGWMGHEAPFDFDPDYRPAEAIHRMRVGTPPVISLSAYDTALDLWADVDLAAIRAQSILLSERFISEVETRCAGFGLVLASPRDPKQRGSQVSFHFEHGYPAMQALIADDVIGDFRAPDIMRFGLTPLYISVDDVVEAASRFERILKDRTWDQPQFHARAAVT